MNFNQNINKKKSVDNFNDFFLLKIESNLTKMEIKEGIDESLNTFLDKKLNSEIVSKGNNKIIKERTMSQILNPKFQLNIKKLSQIKMSQMKINLPDSINNVSGLNEDKEKNINRNYSYYKLSVVNYDNNNKDSINNHNNNSLSKSLQTIDSNINSNFIYAKLKYDDYNLHFNKGNDNDVDYENNNNCKKPRLVSNIIHVHCPIFKYCFNTKKLIMIFISIFNGIIFFYKDNARQEPLNFLSLNNSFILYEQMETVSKTNFFSFSIKFCFSKILFYCCSYNDYKETTSKITMCLNWFNSEDGYLKNHFILSHLRSNLFDDMLNTVRTKMSFNTHTNTHTNTNNVNAASNTSLGVGFLQPRKGSAQDPTTKEAFEMLLEEKDKEFDNQLCKELMIRKTSILNDFEILEQIGQGKFSLLYKVKYKLCNNSNNNNYNNKLIEDLKAKNTSKASVITSVSNTQNSNNKNITNSNNVLNSTTSNIRNIFLNNTNSTNILHKKKYFIMKILFKNKMTEIDYICVKREIAVMQSLKKLPNISKLLYYYENENCIYLIIEHIELSTTLQKYIIENKNKTIHHEKEVKSIIIQLVAIIDSLYSVGVIHRDLKTENIMLINKFGKNIVNLIDLGLARFIGNNEMISNEPFGTLCFSSPEVILNKDYNYKSECFSIGVITYSLLFGSYPFIAENNERMAL